MGKSLDKWQFGDFQTPKKLAVDVLNVLKDNHQLIPDCIIEPSCGEGVFLEAAIREYANARILGVEINPDYSAKALEWIKHSENIEVKCSDFFEMDWSKVLNDYSGKILFTGNPPWVTASELAVLNSRNVPKKNNFQKKKGIEAITGSSNFDISEWMLREYVNWIENREGYIGILCKTSVARKVFRHVAATGSKDYECHIYSIDAQKQFSASVDACFFVMLPSSRGSSCFVYDTLDAKKSKNCIGVRYGELVNDTVAFDKWHNLRGQDSCFVWRSGVKHDCSKVMELSHSNDGLQNGLGEQVDIESSYVYPLLKSSDVANGRIYRARKSVVVTQSYVGEPTSQIAVRAPKTWYYLNSYKERLDNRASSIYKGKPKFSVFGIGEYSFSDWKIAISGMYKKLEFQLISPILGQPVMVDDTVYFLPLASQKQAEFVYDLLCSKPASEFLSSLIFWDEKRPITTRVLRQLNIRALAKVNGVIDYYDSLLYEADTKSSQLTLAIG